MTVIKRMLCIFCAVALIFSCISCKKNNGGGSDTVTLLIDMHGWGPTLNTTPTPENPKVVRTPQLVADEFMKLYPNVKIKWVRNKNVSALEEEMSQWFTTQISTGNCPTIAYSWGTKFQYNDWYVDLTEYLEKPNPYVSGNEKWKDLFEGYLFENAEIKGINGSIYAVPVFLYVGPATGWFYNKKVFEDAGITTTPKTWKEFLNTISAVKSSSFEGTAAAPWSYFSSLQLDQWAMLSSLGPSFASYIFEETDYDGNGIVSEVEQLHATLEGKYSPVEHQYARDLYSELRKYYKEVLDSGWLTTDYLTMWQNGNVAMLEDGTWRLIDEKNARNRDFETGMFTSPIISNDSYDYLPEIEYTEKGPYQPGVDFQLNIMQPAVEGKPEVLDAAVKFLQFLTQPEYLSIYAEEWGADLPATKDSTYSPLLNEWMEMQFPKTRNTAWPQAFVTEYNSKLNRLFAEWLNGRKSNAQFYAAVDEYQKAGANEAIKKMGINTAGWND